MRIWIVEIGEPIPLEPGVRLLRYGCFSEWLVAAGHDVTWWLSGFSHAPKREIVDRDCAAWWQGVRLQFIKSCGYRRNISLARLAHNRDFAARFQCLAAHSIEHGGRPDVLIAPVPTIEIVGAARRISQRYRIPLVVDIRDEWPDEIVDLAPRWLRPVTKLAFRGGYAEMRRACKSATAIVAVSERYLKYGLCFADRVRSPTDAVIPLGYTINTVSAEAMDDARRWRAGLALISNAFTVCFFGTIGRFFDLETLIVAAKRLEHEFPFQLLLGGDGSTSARFRQLASDSSNVRFLGWLTAAQIAAIMEVSHAGIAPYKHTARMSLPNKPFEYMAGGLPVISTLKGELKELLATERCGATYYARSADDLCAVIRRLHDCDAERRAMGKRAYRLVSTKFDADRIFNRYLRLLRAAVDTFPAAYRD